MFLYFRIFTNCAKVYYGKLCSFELWKKTQIIHGNVRLYTGGRITEQHDIGIGSSLKEMIPNEDFGLKPKEEYILMPGAKFPVDNFSIEIIAKEAVENTN
jgi:hypothetical protein